MPRNLEAKRAYDRDRYARLREEDLAGVRAAERARKQKQRKRKLDPHSVLNTFNLDDPGIMVMVESEFARGKAQLV